MKISARVHNSAGMHSASVRTDGNTKAISIAPKTTGLGSSVNGGELLLLALATCYCNDIYREAAKLGITVERVAVEVDAEFGGPGEPGRNITYRARIAAPKASPEDLRALMERTDQVAEIHNTLRAGTPVTFTGFETMAG